MRASLPIYEGTNGIQAIDLVMRKLPLSGGAAVRAQIAAMRAIVTRVSKDTHQGFGHTASRLREAVESLDRATSYLPESGLGQCTRTRRSPGATPYLRLFALAQGGAALADMALAASALDRAGDADPLHAGRIALCRFFAENIAVGARGSEERDDGSGVEDFLDDCQHLSAAGNDV